MSAEQRNLPKLLHKTKYTVNHLREGNSFLASGSHGWEKRRCGPGRGGRSEDSSGRFSGLPLGG